MIPSTRIALLRSPTARLTSNLLQPHRCASTLVIAEPSNNTLAAATRSAITAAQKLHSGPITLLNLTSPGNGTPTDPAGIPSSISHVLNANLPNVLAETASSAIQAAQSLHSYTHIVAPATKFGGHVVPRAAAMLGASPVTDVVDILAEDTFVRPLYAGNALCKVRSTKDDGGAPTVLTVRSTSFPRDETDGSTADVRDLPPSPETAPLTEFVSASVSASTRPDLSSAPIVVSGGRGMKNGDNFRLLEDLADKLQGAAVGASRAAVDAGFVPNDLQVGQTGKVVAPDLYIAVGISGAIQHLSGMKDSKTIVAINNDPEAPIFQVADYGLSEDLFKVVPEMTEKL